MNDKQINWILKILAIVVMIAITVLLDRFVFLTAKGVLWVVCGMAVAAIWDSEVQ
jgi:hypothetical protein